MKNNEITRRSQKINIEKILETISVEAIMVAFKHIEILKMLPSDVKSIGGKIKVNKPNTGNKLNDLERYGIIIWHKGTGKVEKNGRTEMIFEILQMMKKDLEPNMEDTINDVLSNRFMK